VARLAYGKVKRHQARHDLGKGEPRFVFILTYPVPRFTKSRCSQFQKISEKAPETHIFPFVLGACSIFGASFFMGDSSPIVTCFSSSYRSFCLIKYLPDILRQLFRRSRSPIVEEEDAGFLILLR
jgi:hypothetical protein